MITEFRGTNDFLSNFFSAPIIFEGVPYLNTEAAFQACKLADPEARGQFSFLDPGAAKKRGRAIKLRPDWDSVKDDYMYRICNEKFRQYPNLLQRLIATGKQELIEGNMWHDNYWGVCMCEHCDEQAIGGKNRLGEILMRIRSEQSV